MSYSTTNSNPIYKNPVALLQDLIRFDTTNPPGNEVKIINYIHDLLARADIDSRILGKDPKRPNLVSRIKGAGNAPPLLLYGHVDVVTTEGQEWRYPPFEGRLVDDYVWGRGTLDMKSGVAMMISSFIRAKLENLDLAGDIVLAVLADEEAGGDFGAKYLVEDHREYFDGVRYALGESGGATRHWQGRRFYPIQIAEKQLCWMIARVKGPGGHGARPVRGGAMARLGKFLTQLDQNRLPVHITAVTRQMLEALGEGNSPEIDEVIQKLLDPKTTDMILDGLGEVGTLLDPLLHNTVNATIVRGGNKVNVVPSKITIELDGRLLPGFRPEDLIAELREIVGDDLELSVHRFDSGPEGSDMGLFDMLAAILEEADPGAKSMPMMLPGVTDSRFFSQIGIQTYGFTPMKMPDGFEYTKLVHAADERIPAEAVIFGSEAMYKALQRYGC